MTSEKLFQGPGSATLPELEDMSSTYSAPPLSTTHTNPTEPLMLLSSRTSSLSNLTRSNDPDPCQNPCKHHPRTDSNAPHARNLDRFVRTLGKTLKRLYPRSHGSYELYDRACVLLIRWDADDLNLAPEMKKLRRIFEAMYFTEDPKDTVIQEYLIPSESFTGTTKLRIIQAMHEYASKTSDLLIIYYGGHAEKDLSQRCIWFPSWDIPDDLFEMPKLDWTDLQNDKFCQEQPGHVVYIFDCCYAGSAARTPGQSSFYKGVKELVVASSRTELAEGDADKSFTQHLILELEEYQRTGEFCTIDKVISGMKKKSTGLVNRPDRFGLSDRANAMETLHIRFRSNIVAPQLVSPYQAMKKGDDFETRVLLAVRLHNPSDPRQIDDWSNWLKRLAPGGVADIDVEWTDYFTKFIRLESAFKHGSTLMIFSMPTICWKEIPKYPEYQFIDYVQSENLASKNKEWVGKHAAIQTEKELTLGFQDSKYPHLNEDRQQSIFEENIKQISSENVARWLQDKRSQSKSDADSSSGAESSDPIDSVFSQEPRGHESEIQTSIALSLVSGQGGRILIERQETPAKAKLLRKVENFDSLGLRQFRSFTFHHLSEKHNCIRLLRLSPGGTQGVRIYGELIEVMYLNNKFCIPLRAQKAGAGVHSNTSGSHLFHDEDREDDGVRSGRDFLDQQHIRAEDNGLKTKESDVNERMEFVETGARVVEYEVLSWSRGTETQDAAIIILQGNYYTYKMRVDKNLALALRYLRRPDSPRFLWIDSVCVNQADPEERSQQICMMSTIYAQAQTICVWLGPPTLDSLIAMKLVESAIGRIVAERTDGSQVQRLRPLLSLIGRDWFERAWAFQEIFLARTATVYCGHAHIPWKSLEAAIQLFLESETAVSRTCAALRSEDNYSHVSAWLQDTPKLGAGLMVQAMSAAFRTPKEDFLSSNATASRRRGLFSLENLVTTMTPFHVYDPRDAIYSLLAIAKDATPHPSMGHNLISPQSLLATTLPVLERFLTEKPFVVDYNRPYSDVCRDFVEFCILRKYEKDPTQALDILCRPWAREPPRDDFDRLSRDDFNRRKRNASYRNRTRLLPRRTVWKTRDRLVEENKHPGGWVTDGRSYRYRYIEDDTNSTLGWKIDIRHNMEYVNDILAQKEWNTPCRTPGCTHGAGSGSEAMACTAIQWRPSSGWPEIAKRYFPPKNETKDAAREDTPLPSWVALCSQAAFVVQPGSTSELRTAIHGMDPLVGLPSDDHRKNYNAGGGVKLDVTKLRFRKRPAMGHYSLFVEGFEIDEVAQVEASSQLGSLPVGWLKLAGYTNFDKDPPDEFWRTLVAGRGRDNKNPPLYYTKACRESILKGNPVSGAVQISALIQNDSNSFVVEFCRRVQAVVRNRHLFRTRGNRLGLASNVKEGDKICILKGCTVPVILNRNEKARASFGGRGDTLLHRGDLALEREEDSVECLKACLRRAERNRERKARCRSIMDKYSEAELQEIRYARQAYLKKDHQNQECQQRIAEELAKEELTQKNQKHTMHQLARIISEERRKKARADLDATAAKLSIRDPGTQSLTEAARSQMVTAEQGLAAAQATGMQATKEEDEAFQRAADLTEKPRDEFSADVPGQRHGERARERETGSWGSTSLSRRSVKLEQEKIGTESETDAAELGEDYWYEFKGECYLHGMMEGEAISLKVDYGLTDQIFELR